jgi:cation diffusion facilitator family transporter
MGRPAVRAGVIALVAGLLIMAAKFAAWWVTGSSAIFADAAESIVNVIAAAVATYSVAVAARPPDQDHPYGHGKAESLSAAIEGTLILVAAAAIALRATTELVRGPELERLGLGIAVAGTAGVANLLLGLYLIHVGHRTGSEAISADGAHVLTDVVTTAGTVLALVAVQLTGIVLLDPLVALLVAANVLRTGWRVIRRALASLLDEADFELIARIGGRLEVERRPEWVEVHQLRTWSAGDRIHVDVHLTLPRYLSIEDGHRVADEFETVLKRSIEGKSEPIVHVDPCRDVQCSRCPVPSCPVRSAPLDTPFNFDATSITLPGRV